MTEDASRPEKPPPIHDRLGARLALMLALTILPLGLVGLIKSHNASDEAEARSRLAMMGETMRQAAPEINLIEKARAAAAVLAINVQLYSDNATLCSKVMADVVKEIPQASLVAYVPMSGKMTCASTGRSMDFSQNALFAKIAATDHPGFFVNPAGPVSNTSILAVSHPVLNAAGARIGFISISLPHQALESAKPPDLAEPIRDTLGTRTAVELITFDVEGVILTASGGLKDSVSKIPAQVSLASLAKPEPQVFSGVSVAGQHRIFAVAPIAGGLFLLGSWKPETRAMFLGLPIEPYAFPALMWLSAIVVSLWATERLVTNPLRNLGLAMSRFTRGDRTCPPVDLHQSPVEIRALGHSYDSLTQTILRDEAELENMLHQKVALLREVHHRTGNSLQLIASIMRMHMRQESSATVRNILDGLHDRVMGLATVHMGLYQTSGQKDVQMDTLFNSVIQQISAMAKQHNHDRQFTTSLEPIRLIPDQAVPMALLLTELLSGMAVRNGTAIVPINIALTLIAPGKARLHITGPALNSGSPIDQPAPSAIGSQLVRGFANQIGGALTVASTQDQIDVALDFPIRESADL